MQRASKFSGVLVLSSQVYLVFSKTNSLMEAKPCRSFRSHPLLIHLSPGSAVVSSGGGKKNDNMVKFQCFSEPVSLNCNFHMCLFILSPSLCEKGRWKKLKSGKCSSTSELKLLKIYFAGN